MPEIPIRYDAPPTLSEFLDSDAFIRCCIGPVGSGKSSVCVMEILRRACEQAPLSDGKRRTRFAVIRNTYRELEDTTRKTFAKWIPQDRRFGKWNEADFSFTMKFNDVECEVLFRSLDKPGDIHKLLSLELTGAYINEVREVPKQVLDMLTSRVGRYPSPDEGGPTWRGIWMDTNPWHSGHWGQKFFENVASVPRALLDELGLKEPRDFAQCFRQPGARSPEAENLNHLVRGYYAQQMIGKDSEWIRVYVDGEDAKAAEGSVYGALVSMLKQRGGVSPFIHGSDEVFTVWDLGIADMCAIWWFRLNGMVGRDGRRGVDVLDWYEAHNQPLRHYFEVIRSKPYKYVRHFLPHDARARSLQTGISTIEQVQTALGSVAIVPQLDVDQGIEAARWLLEQPTTRFHSRCDLVPQSAEYSGVGLLAEYRYEWDEVRKVFSRTPLHNFASHCFTGDTEVLTRNGMQRIMDLPFTGEVLTPCGWKPYRNPRVSKRNAPLVEVAFADGLTVRCTPDHLFLTDRGWRSTESLRPTSRIQSSLTRSLSSLTATYGVSFLRACISSAVNAGTCTGRYGLRLLERFRRAVTFITETRILATTNCPTWSAWTPLNISAIPLHADARRERLPESLRGREKPQPNGIAARLAGCGILAWRDGQSLGSSGSERIAPASTAARLSPCSAADEESRSGSAATTASRRHGAPSIRITTVRPIAERADVWDLTVPDGECFSLANGAVVHNSADAFRYLSCTVRQSDLLTQPPVPEEEKPPVRDLRTISIRAYLGEKWDPTRPTATRQD